MKNVNYDPDYWVGMRDCETIVRGLIAKLDPVTGSDDLVDGVYHMMWNRMMEMVLSLKVLEIKGIHDHYRDSAVICRAMYDLHLQFLYVLTDPPVLAKQYTDFAHVENLSIMSVFDKYQSKVSVRMKARPDYLKVKSDVEQWAAPFRLQFQYLDSNQKMRWRTNWYITNLDTVADRAGYKDEYHIMQKLLSAIVHSSSLTLLHDLVPGHMLLHDGWHMLLRVLGGIAAKLNVALSPVEQGMYDRAKQSMI